MLRDFLLASVLFCQETKKSFKLFSIAINGSTGVCFSHFLNNQNWFITLATHCSLYHKSDLYWLVIQEKKNHYLSSISNTCFVMCNMGRYLFLTCLKGRNLTLQYYYIKWQLFHGKAITSRIRCFQTRLMPSQPLRPNLSILLCPQLVHL